VEDNVDDRVLMSHILGQIMNYQFDAAKDGLDAILMAEGKDYDIILVDLQLPDILGWDIIKNLRRTERYRATPIIAVTAYNHADAYRMSTLAGCSSYLTKPIDIDRFTQTISALLSDAT